MAGNFEALRFMEAEEKRKNKAEKGKRREKLEKRKTNLQRPFSGCKLWAFFTIKLGKKCQKCTISAHEMRRVPKLSDQTTFFELPFNFWRFWGWRRNRAGTVGTIFSRNRNRNRNPTNRFQKPKLEPEPCCSLQTVLKRTENPFDSQQDQPQKQTTVIRMSFGPFLCPRDSTLSLLSLIFLFYQGKTLKLTMDFVPCRTH